MSERRDFEDSYREWGTRPTKLAAKDVVERLGTRQPQLGTWAWRPALAMVVLLAALVGGVTLWLPRERTGGTRAGAPQPPAQRLETTADAEDVVVVWVDEQTPVQVFLTEASAGRTE